MSAFERRRLQNIEANRAILTDISATAKKVIPDKPKPKASAPRRRSEPVKRESTRPTRVSSRLAGLEADNETLKRKLAVEAEHLADEARAKKMRVSDDLSLGDIVVDGKKYVSSISGLQSIIRGAQPGVRTFGEEDVQETTDENLKSLRKRMNGLKLYEHWAPNGKHDFAIESRSHRLIPLQTSRLRHSECMRLAFILPRTNRLCLRVTKREPWAFSMALKLRPKLTMTTRTQM